LYNFLGAWFPDADLDGVTDEDVAREFAALDDSRSTRGVIKEAAELLSESEFPGATVGELANRHFESVEEAREWLAMIVRVIEATWTSKPSERKPNR
jgi:hypothetical protein